MRFLWLLVTQFMAHTYQWQFVRNRPIDIPGALFSEINQQAAMLTPNYFFIFCILIKIHKRWLISWIHCTLSEFLNKLLKEQKQLHFHISLYNESAAWLSEFRWGRIRQESLKLGPPSYCVIPDQAFEATGLSKIFQEMRSRVQCETIFFSTLTL